MKQIKYLTLAAAVLVGTAASAHGAFTPGNLVVTQIDWDAADTWGDYTGAVKLVEFTTAPGAPAVQSITMPTEVSGENRRLTLPAGYFRAGHLSRSVDQRYLVLGGYDAPVGVYKVGDTMASVYNRVVGRVDWMGNIDTTTALTDCFQGSGGDFRMVATVDGTKYWLVGKASSSGDAATRFAVHGSTFTNPPGKLHSTTSLKDPRSVNIFNGQLYVGSNNSGFRGVTKVGTGLPETGNQPITLIAASPGSSASAYDFFFLDENTLYIADDRTAAALGGLEKFTFDGATGTWVYQYTLSAGLGPAEMQLLRSVTGTKDEAGNPVLYAITAEDLPGTNRLVTVTDTGPDSVFTTLQTAPAGTVFRGVDWAPVPEPGAAALLATGAAIVLRRRRR